MTDKERISELEAAVSWALGEGDSDFGEIINSIGPYWWRNELRAKAFPPKFEEVEVKEWVVIDYRGRKLHYEDPETPRSEHPLSDIIEMTGHYKRPIPAKVKKREEIELLWVNEMSLVFVRGEGNKLPLKSAYFREWYE